MTIRKVEDEAVNALASEVVTKVTQWTVAKKQAEAARIAAEKAAEAARIAEEKRLEAERREAERNTPDGYIKAVKEAALAAGINVDALTGDEFFQIDELLKKAAFDYFYTETGAEPTP